MIKTATIDDKLKVFAKIVFDKVQKDSEEKIRKSTEEYDKYLEEEKRNILRESEAVIKQMKKKAEAKKNQIISKANMDSQHEVLKRKKEIFEEALRDIEKMAESFTVKPEYARYLEKCIRTGLSGIDTGNVVIYFTSRDIVNRNDKINELVCKYKKPEVNVAIEETSKNIIGGCICEDMDRTVRVDCSMAAAIEENRSLIGKILADNLQ